MKIKSDAKILRFINRYNFFDQVVHLIRSYIKPAIGNWIVRNPAERHSFQNRILLKTPHA